MDNTSEEPARPSALTSNNWRHMERLVRSAEALIVKKRHRKVGKPFDLQQREEYHSGAMFWLPQKVREAHACEAVKEQEQHQEMLAKANRKELRLAAKLYKEQIAKEKHVAREEAKVADCAAKIKAQNTKKAAQTSQLGKRRASRPPLSAPKRQKHGGVSEGVAALPEAAPAAAPKVNSRGRHIKVPHKYR
ncbi:hypothetical protein CC86DRAFT_378003 [Ophiobolus disseminans]|uniref:Uncharacterized protein n=1 Tax=Ophiobolus disseminans TaxID=1469910 RepID=A0A6A7AED8_9PLEO|nr:hypothetical protein CC86DRAFT_378003 [Ophiobolus disseminans]